MDTCVVTLATCSLNQFALDFQGNKDRILQAVAEAKAASATYLITPELSIPGKCALALSPLPSTKALLPLPRTHIHIETDLGSE